MKSGVTLILAVLLTVCCSASLGASDPALELGNRLLAGHHYDEAITEYKRFLCFHPDDPRRADVLHKAALAYRAQHRWAEATDLMEQSIRQTEDDVTRESRHLDLAVIKIAVGHSYEALSVLRQIARSPGSEENHRRAMLLQSVTHLAVFQWDEAERALASYYEMNNSLKDKVGVIDRLFGQAYTRPQKSATLARWLSTFLPGTGQIYVGNWHAGLNALLLNGLLASAIANAATQEDRDAILYAVLLTRYYFGNRYRAGEAAEQFNRAVDERHAQAILNMLATHIGRKARVE